MEREGPVFFADPLDRVAYPAGDCLASALGGVTGPSRTAADAGRTGELAFQELDLFGDACRASGVVPTGRLLEFGL